MDIPEYEKYLREQHEKEAAAKEEKARRERELARMELAHIEAQRAQLLQLYEGIEAERDAATTQARKNCLTRQLINLDEKIFKLDVRKAKVYNAACAA